MTLGVSFEDQKKPPNKNSGQWRKKFSARRLDQELPHKPCSAFICVDGTAFTKPLQSGHVCILDEKRILHTLFTLLPPYVTLEQLYATGREGRRASTVHPIRRSTCPNHVFQWSTPVQRRRTVEFMPNRVWIRRKLTRQRVDVSGTFKVAVGNLLQLEARQVQFSVLPVSCPMGA